jgi:hypothetical protein
MAPNLVAGKLIRCPHCGKWSLQPRASQDLLEQAEARYFQKDKSELKKPELQDLKQQLEESRFEE